MLRTLFGLKSRTDSDAPLAAASDHVHVSQARNRRILASASAGVFQRLMQVVSTLLLMPLLLRTLGPTQFGVWGAAASLAWLAGFADIGTGAALVTLVARSIALQNTVEARRHIAGTLSFGCGLAGLIGIGALAVGLIGLPKGLSDPYLIAIGALAVNIPLNAANSVWMALQKGYISGFWELVQTLLTLAGLVATAAFSHDVRIYVAVVYAGLTLSNLGSLIHLFVRHPELRPQGLVAPLAAVKSVAGEGMSYFVLGLAGSLSYLLDNILALAILGPESSARMTISLRICITALGAMGVASQPLWPAFAEAAHTNDWPWIRNFLIRGSVLLTGIAVAGSAVLLVYGERLLRWWLRDSLSIDQTLLWAISVWAVSQALIRVPCLLLNGLSIIRYQFLVSGIATAIALGLKFILSSRLGVAGILWGTTAPVLIIVFPAVMWRIFHWHKRILADSSSPAGW